MNLGKVFRNGLFDNNPVFIQLLGMCPLLAVTSSVVNGIGMGVASTVVVVASNILISILRKGIPNKIRIPCFIVIIATFVTMVDLLMHAFTPDLWNSLGLFIPLIVVNCMILGRAEAFASKNRTLPSVMDGLGMGIGFTIALAVLASFRELLGTGALFSGFQQYLGVDITIKIIPDQFVALAMILPPGAFIGLGLILGFINFMRAKRTKKVDPTEGCCH